MQTMDTVELFKGQLLWGKIFMSRFQVQLDELYGNAEFMNLIHTIQSAAPQQENEKTIDEIKSIAKTTLYDKKAVYQFPALKEITDCVAADGGAKNSAYISTYLAIRIFELSGVVSDVTEKNAPRMIPEKPAITANELDFRQKWPAEYRCEDGHYVRSKNEMLVDNWLYHHSLCHAYEKAVFSGSSQQMYCSDFYIPQYKLFVEI